MPSGRPPKPRWLRRRARLCPPPCTGLWRLLIDWPAALALPAAREAFIAWRAARGRPHFPAVTAELLAATLQGEWAWECRRLPGEAEDENLNLARMATEQWLAYWRAEAAPIPAGLPATARPASIAAWAARRAQALEAAEALADGRPYRGTPPARKAGASARRSPCAAC
jgi:hypothetical protein